MRWQRRDVTIASRCAEASFSLMREDKEECIEGVENLKCLARMLNRSDDDWTEVWQNFGKEC